MYLYIPLTHTLTILKCNHRVPPPLIRHPRTKPSKRVLLFPTCQVRVVTFYVSDSFSSFSFFSSASCHLPAPNGSVPHRTSIASSRWQCSHPDLNCGSVPIQTPTASSQWQCSHPGLKLSTAVFPTWTQLQAPDGSVPHRTSTNFLYVKFNVRIYVRKSVRISARYKVRMYVR